MVPKYTSDILFILILKHFPLNSSHFLSSVFMFVNHFNILLHSITILFIFGLIQFYSPSQRALWMRG